MSTPPATPDRYDEAVRAFRKRVPMTDPEFRKLEAAERTRAFWVAGVTQARIVQDVMSALDRAIEDGTTLEEFKAAVETKLVDSWGTDDPLRLETVFRTNVMSSYNAGRYEIFSDPDVQKDRPFVRFDAVGDSRTSDVCDALDGKVLPADDPFVKAHWPPLHHNCRSQWTPLTEAEAEDEGITRSPPKVQADEGFGRVVDPENLEPDLSGFDPPLLRLVKDRI